MPAQAQNIVIEQGADWTMSLTFTDRDLTGCSARMQIRENVSSPTPMISLTSSPGDGITITPGPPGIVDIAISHTLTGGLTRQLGVYDLELVTAGGAVERVLKGTVRVDFEVTR